MTLKRDAKFKEKLTCGFKYDIRPKIKILSFSEMRVTRKIFTRAAANLFF